LRNPLTGAVTGLRAAVLTTREQILQQQEHYQQHARQAEEQRPIRWDRAPRQKHGCYQFDDTEGLFCPAYYDKQGGRVRTIPHKGNSLACPNCRSVYPYR
jgi:hypothetical protein